MQLAIWYTDAHSLQDACTCDFEWNADGQTNLMCINCQVLCRSQLPDKNSFHASSTAAIGGAQKSNISIHYICPQFRVHTTAGRLASLEFYKVTLRLTLKPMIYLSTTLHTHPLYYSSSSFFFYFIPLFHRNLCFLLFCGNKRDILETLTRCTDWWSRASLFFAAKMT